MKFDWPCYTCLRLLKLRHWSIVMPRNLMSLANSISTPSITSDISVSLFPLEDMNIDWMSWHEACLSWKMKIIYHPDFIITGVSEVIMFSPCVFVCVSVCLCLSRCLSGRFNYEGLGPHKQYFAGTVLGMSSCASYASHTHDVIDDVTRSQSRSNFEIGVSPTIFELERRSKAQNFGNAYGYLSGMFNFRYHFR